MLLLSKTHRAAVEFLSKSTIKTRLLAVANTVSDLLDAHLGVSQQVGSFVESLICQESVQGQAGLSLE